MSSATVGRCLLTFRHAVVADDACHPRTVIREYTLPTTLLGQTMALEWVPPGSSYADAISFLTRHLWARCGTEVLIGSMAWCGILRLILAPRGHLAL